MGRLRINLLGGFEVASEQADHLLALPTQKTQALLAFLSMRSGEPFTRESLATLLWGDSPDRKARQSLRQALLALRRAFEPLEPSPLSAAGDSVALVREAVDVDVERFESLLRDGAPGELARAAALYRGELLQGFAVTETAFDEWLFAERERLRELALDGLARLLSHQMKGSEVEAAIATALRVLAIDPLQEATHRALMRLYARQGRRGAAMRQYQSCIGVLERELGVQPEADTRELYATILQEEKALDDDASGSAPPSAGAAGTDLSGGTTPLVGREAEATRLRARLDEGFASQAPIVALVGEPGIGKTRLVQELGAEARRRGGKVVAGCAHESETILPFGPWVSVLRSAGVVEARSVWQALSPVWRGEIARLLPELGEPGLELSTAPANVGRLFEAVAQLVLRAAEETPLLLVLEDLQWADEMTLRLLAFVGRRLSSARLLVLLTAREEALDAESSALRGTFVELERETRLDLIRLGRLPEAETRKLARALAPAKTDAASLDSLGARVWTATSGNPLAVVESVRVLGEAGGGEGRLSAALPAGQSALIRRHVDALSAQGREAARVAAIIGRPFEFGLLADSLGTDEAQAARGVEELVRRRLLRESDERLELYHERIGRVVYDEVAPPRRVALHRNVALVLARKVSRGPELQGELATHFRAGELWAQAVDALVRVAETSLGRYAYVEAVAAFDHALRCAEHLDAGQRDRCTAEVLLRLGLALTFLGRFSQALTHLRDHEACFARLGRLDLDAARNMEVGNLLSFLGDQKGAADHAKRSLRDAEACGERSTAGKARIVLAFASFWSGRHTDGAARAREAVRDLDAARDAWWVGLAHFYEAINLAAAGDLAAADAAAGRCRDVGDAIDDRAIQVYAAWTRGWIAAAQGRGAAAVELCAHALATAPDPLNVANASGFLGYALLESGDVAGAVAALARGVEESARFSFKPYHGWLSAILGDAHRAAGDLARARACAETGLAICTEVRFPLGMAWARRSLGGVLWAEGSLAGAAGALAEAAGGFEAIGAAAEAARTRLDLVEVLAAQGDHAAAARHLREGAELARKTGAARQIARAEALAGAVAQGATA